MNILVSSFSLPTSSMNPEDLIWPFSLENNFSFNFCDYQACVRGLAVHLISYEHSMCVS